MCIKLLSGPAAPLLSLVVMAQSLTGQVTIALTPSSTSLSPSQLSKFEASVRGTNVPGVMWSVMPPIGTLTVSSATTTMDGGSPTPVSTVDGTYQAPSTINSPQAVTLVARSVADPSKAASATIYLNSTVGIAVTPSSISVGAGQSATFQASIGGTYNTSVSWSVSPPVGTIANGMYKAPAIVSALQTIILTAASLADPSKTAQSSITLTPNATSISVSPAQTTLGPSASEQFTATIEGGTSAVVWSISPNVGSISPSGLYTAPSTASGQQTVLITAGISADPTKKASALVTLAGPTPPPLLPPIQLPVEVIGLDGMTSMVSFNIPQGSNLSGPITLWMQVHGLRYQTQASFQLNNSGWIPINESTVTLLGQAGAYGGIGGGFHTIQMTWPVPLSSINIGTNNISFRFNGTDGRVSGFRVLAFNFQGPTGNKLLSSASFVYEDPNTWQPPSSVSSDIAAGKTLWYNAPLTVPTATGPAPIRATCSNCHAQDGRDLKYFNYSNNSIRTRSMFHGLTAQQGDQIASYIRALNVVNPGRPWNPPYQPGPGLDSQPVEQWSAGAGLGAVLDSDQSLINTLFPNGFQSSVFAATGNLNVRETPIALQLPDWNSWLPAVHPMDAWGDAFVNSGYYQDYLNIRSQLRYGDPVAYANTAPLMNTWIGNYAEFTIPKLNPPFLASGQPDPSVWTPTFINKVYSTGVFNAVKSWEINQEFGLEGMARTVFTHPLADSRAWHSSFLFLASPNMLHIPRGFPGLDNGKVDTFVYLAFIWYHTQLILNNSNGYQQEGTAPIDWPYVYGFIQEISLNANPGQAGLMTLWKIKALQISNNGSGPDALNGPLWQYLLNDPATALVQNPGGLSLWTNISPSTQTAISEGYLRAFLDVVEKFTPQQFYTGGAASPNLGPVRGMPFGAFADRVWYAIPLYRNFGVSQSLINEFATWASTVWPLGNWSLTTTDVCTPNPPYGVVCGTYH
jgi:hypothetical protein